MCVRYTLHKTDAALAAISRALGTDLARPEWALDRYNVTLTHVMPVVALGAERAEVRPMRWGLVPASDRAAARPRLLANAKSETVASMPAFRRPVASRRCLVPANGYFEWLARGSERLPHLFTLRSGESFALAGLWDPADAAYPETFCVLTTRPNEVAARIHDRMPVVLTGEAMAGWLGREPLVPEELARLTAPIDAALLDVRRVSRFVSNSRNEGPGCLGPPEPEASEPEFDFG